MYIYIYLLLLLTGKITMFALFLSLLLVLLFSALLDDGSFTFEDGGETTMFKGCDIDLFLYDLTPEQALKKIKHIYQTIKKNLTTETLMVVRTGHAITFVPPWPRPQV